MKVIVPLISALLFMLYGCLSTDSSGVLDEKLYHSLEKEIAQCPEIVNLAVAFSGELKTGQSNGDYIKIYNSIGCSDKSVYERAVRAALLDNETNSQAYIDQNLSRAGKAYDQNGNIFNLSGTSAASYIPVSYINDNLQTYEEAIKDLSEIKSLFSENPSDTDLKFLLIYNASESYWGSVQSIMKSYENNLSWSLMWKAYFYGDDSKLDEEIKSFLDPKNPAGVAEGAIAYAKEQFYDLRVKLYYNSLDFAYLPTHGENVVKGINAVYAKYDTDKAKRQITITNRYGDKVFRNSSIPLNNCNSKLYMGSGLHHPFQKRGTRPIPEIVMNIDGDPYYRYKNIKNANIPAQDKQTINLSSDKGWGTFRNLYLSDNYKVIVTDDLIKYFQNDDQNAVMGLSLNSVVTGKALFKNVASILMTRTGQCGPNVGFYVRPEGKDDEVILYSLDDVFAETNVLSLSEDNFMMENVNNLSDIAAAGANLDSASLLSLSEESDNITIMDNHDLEAYKTSAGQVGEYTNNYTIDLSRNNGKLDANRIDFSDLYFGSTLVETLKMTGGLWNTYKTSGYWRRQVYNDYKINGDSIALIQELYYSDYIFKRSGFVTETVHPFINGVRPGRAFKVFSSLTKTGGEYYDKILRYKYKSSLIKSLSVGNNKYYGFYVATTLLPTSVDDQTTDALQYHILVLKHDKNGNWKMFGMKLNQLGSDPTKATLGGYTLQNDFFELFGSESE